MEEISTNQAGLNIGENWQRWALTAGVVLLFALAGWMIASQVAGNLVQSRQEKAIAAFEEGTGIRVVRIVLTGGGGIIDLQYQVVDPDKALIIHDADNPPMMLDEKSNFIFANPFHEHAARELHTAVTYHELIMNGAGLIQRGSKVTLSVGESRLEHLVVK
jgi:hypothetical protein